MNVLLTTHVAFLAQGYDSTGGASRGAILIGILAFPCLVIYAIIRGKLKDAKDSEKQIAELQQKVAELEEKSENDETDESRLKSAEQGNVYMQYALGIKYQFGMGVEPDIDEAMKWFQKAAAQGDEAAKEQIKRIRAGFWKNE